MFLARQIYGNKWWQIYKDVEICCWNLHHLQWDQPFMRASSDLKAHISHGYFVQIQQYGILMSVTISGLDIEERKVPFPHSTCLCYVLDWRCDCDHVFFKMVAASHPWLEILGPIFSIHCSYRCSLSIVLIIYYDLPVGFSVVVNGDTNNSILHHSPLQSHFSGTRFLYGLFILTYPLWTYCEIL